MPHRSPVPVIFLVQVNILLGMERMLEYASYGHRNHFLDYP